jgi:putative endonuclease
VRNNFHNLVVGQAGETAASAYISKLGYKVVELNWRSKQWGEIDIVAVKDNTLICVEVKSRLSEEFGNPEEAVTKSKVKALKRTIQYYSTQHPELPQSLRIDVVAVILAPGTFRPLSFELFEDAQ